jgi:hypothetical protein
MYSGAREQFHSIAHDLRLHDPDDIQVQSRATVIYNTLQNPNYNDYKQQPEQV